MKKVLTSDDYLRIADRLSPAPRILPRLLNVLSDPSSDVSQIVELISFDPDLTSKVLRASNSAFVGLPEPARDVSEAVHLLGMEFVYQLAAAACGASTFKSSRADSPSARLWRHSATTALAAQLLAADLQLDSGALFTAALLHEIGKAVLAEHWQEEYWILLEQTRCAPAELPELERQYFQLSHGELGGRLLAHWKFPPSIAASVWHHHAPLKGMPFERETACVTLADAVAEAITERQAAPPDLLPLSPGQDRALAVFELTAKDLKSYIARTQENFEFIDGMCQIG
jgi:putative nucleotidyltransferase with HDIG domain